MIVETQAIGKPRDQVIDIPETLTISVSRQDGYAPSVGEIYAALRIALDGMTMTKTKPRTVRKGKR